MCVYRYHRYVPFESLCPNGTQRRDRQRYSCVCIGTIGTSHYVPRVDKDDTDKVFMCVWGGRGVYDTIANSLCVCANGIYHYVPTLRIPMYIRR